MKQSGTGSYAFVFIALIALLALTVGAAYLPLGPWAIVVTLAIASAKAALVLIFFMRLLERPPLVRIFALGGLFWLVVLFLLTFADILTRGDPFI